jgi:hypothetical protein
MAQQQKEDVFLALSFLFVPFLNPRDCLALASTSTVSSTTWCLQNPQTHH